MRLPCGHYAVSIGGRNYARVDIRFLPSQTTHNIRVSPARTIRRNSGESSLEIGRGRYRRKGEEMSTDANFYEAVIGNANQRDEQRLWLEDVINRLTGRPVWKCHEVQYWNHPELPKSLRKQGYYVYYQSSDQTGHPIFLMFSRSDTDELLTLERILDDLRSGEIAFPFEKFGAYYAQPKRRCGPGTYATIRFGTRWYMLSRCGSMNPSHLALGAPELLLQDWQQFDRPAVHGRVIDRNPTLGHHLLQIPKTQRIRAIPAHTRQNHIQRKMQAL